MAPTSDQNPTPRPTAAPQPSAAALAADAQSCARPDAPGAHPEWERLVRTIWRLRQPDGCPWDRKQSHDSIARNMVEEAYEAVDAIEAQDPAHLCEELGDVLMQVLLHAQIDADAGGFTIDDVCHGLNEKLVRRHPHVFGDSAATDADEVLQIWDQVKVEEHRAQAQATPQVTHLLDAVPRALPALMQCQKISKRAAKAGFECPALMENSRKLIFDNEEAGVSSVTSCSPRSTSRAKRVSMPNVPCVVRPTSSVGVGGAWRSWLRRAASRSTTAAKRASRSCGRRSRATSSSGPRDSAWRPASARRTVRTAHTLARERVP